MTLQQITYFQSVAHSLSFTKAAKQCFVSQTAISRQVALLEKELHVQLLERDKVHVRLTEAGRHFYERTLGMTAELQKIMEETRQLGLLRQEQLRVGIPTMLEQQVAAPLLRDFHARRPEIHIVTVRASRQELLVKLVEGEVDVVIALDFDLPDLEGLCSRSLREAHAVLLTGRNFAVGGSGSAVSTDDLLGQTLYLTVEDSSAPTQERLNQYFHHLGLDDNPRAYCKDLMEAFLYVSAGLGCCLVPSDAAGWISEDLICREIDATPWGLHYLAIHMPYYNANVEALLGSEIV